MTKVETKSFEATVTSGRPTAPSLDERIASALGSSDQLSSEYLLALYNELDEAVGVADRIARECRAKSIDPLVRDGIAERSRAEDQEFIASRLRNAATPLREVYQKALSREQVAAWNAEVEELRTEIDKHAEHFKSAYTEHSSALINIFRRMVQLDQAADDWNRRAPSGVNLLRHTEAVARNIPTVRDKPFIEQVVLPTLPLFDTGGKPAPIFWPPKPPDIGLEYALMIQQGLAHGGRPPPTKEQKTAEIDRVAEYYRRQERGREQLAAEAHVRAAAEAAERRRQEAGEVAR